MIVGSQKPFEDIWEMVKDFKRVLVFGCNTCVAICHAGGGKEAELLLPERLISQSTCFSVVSAKRSEILRNSDSTFSNTSTSRGSKCVPA